MSTQTHPQTYTGRRVQWIGEPPTGYHVAATYWTEITDTGIERRPRPDEQHRLHTGELGTVGELIRATATGHWYVLRFDGGYELETVLPADTLVRFVDQDHDHAALAPATAPSATAPAAGPRRYAEHINTSPLRRLFALVRWRRHGGQPAA